MLEKADFSKSHQPFQKASLLLLLILALATAVRLPHLGWRGFFLDELWTTEIATARGSLHQHLPHDVIIPPDQLPELFSLTNAPSWWQVWTHMECTHPPLYFLTLRLWMQMFGNGELPARMLSVLASLLAIALLFDVVRMINGPNVALWACLLMALAEPQIDYARQARNYSFLLFTALAAADAMVRIKCHGLNRPRLLGLFCGLLATLLTHYFCAGLILGLFVYSLIRFRGRVRVKVIGTFIAACFVFAICWGKFMWQQRYLFSTEDESTRFLHDFAANHLTQTLRLLIVLPGRLLVVSDNPVVLSLYAALALLYVVPVVLLRHRPDLLIWTLWLNCTMGLIFTMDLLRGTVHLSFIRYTLLAGPAVFVLIPAIVRDFPSRWLRNGFLTAMALWCAVSVPHAYRSWITDPQIVADQVQTELDDKKDLIVLLGADDKQWASGIAYLTLSRYIPSFRCAVVLLSQRASPAIADRAGNSPKVIAIVTEQDPQRFIPGLIATEDASYPGQPEVIILQRTDISAPASNLPASPPR